MTSGAWEGKLETYIHTHSRMYLWATTTKNFTPVCTNKQPYSDPIQPLPGSFAFPVIYIRI